MPPESPETPKAAAPAPGAIRAIAFACVVKCGAREFYPNRTLTPKEEHVVAVVDDRRQCVWLGFEQSWTRIPWSSVNYVSFWPAEDAPS